MRDLTSSSEGNYESPYYIAITNAIIEDVLLSTASVTEIIKN
jgi:hypothetical protein